MKKFLIFLATAVAALFGGSHPTTVINPPIGDVQLAGTTAPIAGTTYNLAGSGVSAIDTSISLQSLTITQTGYKLQPTDLSATFYVTLEPGNNKKQEIVSCTGMVQNGNGSATLTPCQRGRLPFGDYSASSTYAFPHAGGSAVIFSDPPQLFNEYPAKANNEQISGQWGFAQLPTSTTSTPTSPSQLVTVYQLQQATTTGGINAAEAVKGVSQLATAAQAAAGTSLGSTGARLVLPNSLATATPSAAISIPITDSNGKLSSGFGGNANTIATLNAGILVVQNPASATATPTANSIPISNASSTLRGWGLFNGTGVDGALTISSGTTTVSAAGASVLEKDYTTITINGTGALAFSNPAAKGTTIILRAAVCNITSTAQYAITTQDMGGQAGTGGTSPTDGSSANGIYTSVGGGPKGPTSGSSNAAAPSAPNLATSTFSRMLNLIPGAAGGGGSGVGGRNGGNGAGALELDCGSWNVSTTINLAGRPGVIGVSQSSGQGCNAAGGAAHLGAGADGGDNSGNTACATNSIFGGSGGGGGGGDFAGFYNFLTGLNSVVASTTGGLGQPYAGGSTLSGRGAPGFSFVKQNDSLF